LTEKNPAAAGTWKINPATGPLAGEYCPPGDLAITHRAFFLGSLALGTTQVQGSLECPDTVSTRRVLAHLGITFSSDSEGWLTITRREDELTRPEVELDCGNSWSAFNLMSGLLAGQHFSSVVTGSEDLKAKRIKHLVSPLRAMGAKVEYLAIDGYPPLRIKGQPLYPIEYEIGEDLENTKGALLTAALFALGASKLTELTPSADHTERMLKHLGVAVRRSGQTLVVKGEQNVYPRRIKIPGDFSFAAPFIAAAMLVPGSELSLSEVGTNPGRVGLLKVISRFPGAIERERTWQYGTEPVASFTVRHVPEFESFSVAPNLAPYLIREFPLLALLATQAQGVSRLHGARQLKYEIPNRLHLTAQILRSFGADIELENDGLTVHGPVKLTGTEVQCAGDFYLSSMAACAALIADEPSALHGVAATANCYSTFLEDLIGLLSK
jgi:3-phosphoshikimate 1-carboxyvinyltransferase